MKKTNSSLEYFHPRDFNETNWTKLNVITIKLFVLWGSVFKMFCILGIQFISHVLQIPEKCFHFQIKTWCHSLQYLQKLLWLPEKCKNRIKLISFLCLQTSGRCKKTGCCPLLKTTVAAMALPSVVSWRASFSAATQSSTPASPRRIPRMVAIALRSGLMRSSTLTPTCTLETSTVCIQPTTMWFWS